MRVILPALFFFFKITLAIWGLLLFDINFRIICSSSVKNVTGIFIGIALNLYLFGYYGHFNNINSSNPKAGHNFPFLCIIFNFLHQCFIVFSDRSFTSLVMFILGIL